MVEHLLVAEARECDGAFSKYIKLRRDSLRNDLYLAFVFQLDEFFALSELSMIRNLTIRL